MDYGIIGVALSTRVGIAYQNGFNQSRSATFYKEIASIGETPEEKKAIRSEMIVQNMLIMQEYLNLSRTDIKTLLNSSTDRKSTLEWFISQLEMRYKNSALSLQSLEKQKVELLTYLWEVELEIETVKSSMETHFSAAQASNTLDDVDSYFSFRSEYTEAFTDIVFINQFIKQHAFLNNYNKWILDTLINNKQAIINKSYVVIPDSWDQYLRPLELIFDEAEIKK
jgi:aconitase B